MMNTKTTWISIGVVLGLLVGIGGSVYAERKPTQALPLTQIRHMSNVIELIKEVYVEEVDDQEMLDNAIRGMLTGLDPHSEYLVPEDFEDLQVSTSGKFGGLGIEVTMENGFVKVVSPIDDTPAYRAGLQAGDFITMLDDKPVKGMSLSEAVDIMRGEPGSKILLMVVREGEPAPFEVKIVRDIIKIRSVRSKMLEDNFGMVRISQFQQSTGDDVKKELAKLAQENGQPLEGVVLDLRNNPGGLLSAAIDVTDAFISNKLVVYTESRVQGNNDQYFAKNQTAAGEIPVVVLINGGSASASEIVAGALQDHKRAVIMGTQSFGKGSVQSILPIGKDYAVKLTTARYFTPNGRSIQASGITPDIEVEQGSLTVSKREYYKEADLEGHLSNPNGEEEIATEDEALLPSEIKAEPEKPLAERDNQMFQALSLLKALSILK